MYYIEIYTYVYTHKGQPERAVYLEAFGADDISKNISKIYLI